MVLRAKNPVIESKQRNAFTIVELIVVITVIGILAGLTILGFGAWQSSIHISAVKSDLNGAASAMAAARNFSNGYPISTTGTNITSVVSTFTPSAGVTLTYTSGDGSSYCLDGNYSGDTTTAYYIDTSTSKSSPTAGTCATRPIPPTTPTNLVLASTTDTAANLTWTAGSGATSYTGQCATNSGFSIGLVQNVVASTGSATSGAVTGLNPSTYYYCRILAGNSTGSSSYTAAVTGTTQAIAAPSTITPATISTTEIDLSWAAVGSASNYTLQMSQSSSFATIQTQWTVSATSQPATGLSPGITYYFRVNATNATTSTTSGWSSTATAATTVSAVSGLAITTTLATSLTVSWTATPYATSYQYQQATDSGFTQNVVTTSSISGTTNTSTVSAGTTYYIRVQAIGASGSYGAYSSTVSTTTYNSVLPQGTTIASSSNYSMISSNNLYGLKVQGDGNVVVYRLSDSYPMWNKGSVGNSSYTFAMQTDGNLVEYNSSNSAIWSIDESNRVISQGGYYLTLGNDANLIVGTGSVSMWSWMTGKIAPPCNDINNDTFKLINQNSGRAMDVPGASTTAGQQIQQWDYSGAAQQRYVVTYLGSNHWRMLASHDSQAVDDDANNIGSDGAHVQQWTSSGATNQQWTFIPVSGGYCKIQNVMSGTRVIGVTSASTANGALLVQWTDNGSTDHNWLFGMP